MSSSPIDADRLAALMPEARMSEARMSEAGEAEAVFDIPPQGWVKKTLPRTMFGRSLLIMLIPIVLLQAIATWIFYDRLWAAVSWRLASGVSGDVAMAIELLKLAPARMAPHLLARLDVVSDLELRLHRGAALPPPPPDSGTLIGEQLHETLQGRVGYPFEIFATSDFAPARILVQLPQGVLAVGVPSKRLFTPTTYIFVMWMVGSSLVLLAVAIVFLRNQVKSLRRLAAAADAFGKGRPTPPLKIEGALEVRQAAVAFLRMRERIQRQIRQRTQMLAGVSHDLRTPLTRMKLALALLGNDPAVAELQSDVAEMAHMVDGYLDFMRGEGDEMPVETDVALLLEEVAAAVRREGTPLSLSLPPEYVMPLRPNALRRCLGNLIGNARRHSSRVGLSGIVVENGIDILVDDDGPGIPPADRERVFRPFIRLDASRNPATGGIGLGLTIARDVARGHGGEVRLEDSPWGGLRARVHLPR
jgi:two-component system osmolarity sensor histidine kinase EnvZ